MTYVTVVLELFHTAFKIIKNDGERALQKGEISFPYSVNNNNSLLLFHGYCYIVTLLTIRLLFLC